MASGRLWAGVAPVAIERGRRRFPSRRGGASRRERRNDASAIAILARPIRRTRPQSDAGRRTPHAFEEGGFRVPGRSLQPEALAGRAARVRRRISPYRPSAQESL